MNGRAWRWYLLVGAPATLPILVIPESWWYTAWYDPFGLSAVAAILLGVRNTAFQLLAGSLLVMLAGDVGFAVLAQADAFTPNNAINLTWLLAYLLFGAAASRCSTTPTATRPATSSCAAPPRPGGRCCAPATCWPAVAARSSRSCCPPRPSGRPSRSSTGCGRPPRWPRRSRPGWRCGTAPRPATSSSPAPTRPCTRPNRPGATRSWPPNPPGAGRRHTHDPAGMARLAAADRPST